MGRILPLDQGNVVMNELMIGQASPVAGKRLCEIELGEETIICCIIRGARIIVPRGQTSIQTNDKLLVLAAYLGEAVWARCFLVPGVGAVFAGYLFYLLIRGREKLRLCGRQDALIVVCSWILAILFCAVPFQMTGQYNLTQAVFECTSVWSTTGLSVVDVEQCPRIFLMFRSIMLFFGGVVLVLVSVLSDRHGMRLYSAEGHSDRLLPNLVKSVRMIIAIYTSYILSGTFLYMAFGMDWFDALNHSIATLSTGGFSTRPESIG